MPDSDKPDRRGPPTEKDGVPHATRVPDRRAADAPPRYLKVNDTPLSLAKRVFSSRWRAVRDKIGRDFMRRTLRIGVSARIFHPEPGSTGLRSKNLQYLEESIAQWVMSRDVLVFMVPTVNTNGLLHPSNITLRHYARHLDGLVLQGGADVSPQTYSESPTRPEWSGDRARDVYELELLHEFVDAGKPVLGICRGCQLINVAFGGTLFQDIPTQVPKAIAHRDDEKYDEQLHEMQIVPGSGLAALYPGQTRAMVNSIHHQAVKTLGHGLVVEATGEPDGIVEALRWSGPSHVFGIQWHPEFLALERLHEAQLDGAPILKDFLDAARLRRGARLF
jgi:putative glutamine amidotransferase